MLILTVCPRCPSTSGLVASNRTYVITREAPHVTNHGTSHERHNLLLNRQLLPVPGCVTVCMYKTWRCWNANRYITINVKDAFFPSLLTLISPQNRVPCNRINTRAKRVTGEWMNTPHAKFPAQGFSESWAPPSGYHPLYHSTPGSPSTRTPPTNWEPLPSRLVVVLPVTSCSTRKFTHSFYYCFFDSAYSTDTCSTPDLPQSGAPKSTNYSYDLDGVSTTLSSLVILHPKKQETALLVQYDALEEKKRTKSQEQGVGFKIGSPPPPKKTVI